MYDYPDWGFSVLFPQLLGKCQGKTRKDGARPSLFLIFVLFYVFFCAVCIVYFVSFYVLFVCKCVLYYCHRVVTQLQLNISYHILIYRPVCVYNSDQHAAAVSRRSATDIWWLALTEQTRFSAGIGVLLIDNTMSFKSIILRMSNIIDSKWSVHGIITVHGTIISSIIVIGVEFETKYCRVFVLARTLHCSYTSNLLGTKMCPASCALLSTTTTPSSLLL